MEVLDEAPLARIVFADKASGAREHKHGRWRHELIRFGIDGVPRSRFDRAVNRPRHIDVRPFPSNRRLVVAAERAGRRIAPMHGLVDTDVTDARRIIAGESALSLTAFVVASVARAAAAHPEVHAYRNWRGQLIMHRYVDVTTIVEVSTPQGTFPLPHVLRDADIREVRDLSAELREVKTRPGRSRSGRMLERFGTTATRVPGLVPLLYTLMGRSVRMRQVSGTVAVTAVGMFAGGGGFGIAPPTLMSLGLVVGGISSRPRVVDGRIEMRDVLDLTITIDHNVVDGAPAARFGAELRRLIEGAELLRESG
jgi:pyruvate/2-oxoglutarate dehydrogenase complex dihydrolipoamide acyltransferase (E2) component